MMSDGFHLSSFFEGIEAIYIGCKTERCVIKSHSVKSVFQNPVHSFLCRIIIIVDPIQIPQLGIVERGGSSKISKESEIRRDGNVVPETVFRIPQQLR